MLNIGCHLSTSKGFMGMGRDALSIGANTFQFFTRNPRGGAAKAIDRADLAAFLEVHRPDWRSTPPESLPAWSREVAHRLAAELARRIDEAAVVGPINLIALAMRDAPAQGLTAAALHERIAHDLALLRPFSPVCVMTSLNEAQIIARAERLGHIEKRGERFCLPAGQAARLAYFRNNVLHLVRQDRPIGPSGEKAVIPGL